MPLRRVESFDVEESRSDSATGAQQALDVGCLRYPSSARKPELLRGLRRLGALRRRRTCWEAEPSDACVPSSDGDSKLHDPTSSPCAREIHACECGACYGGGRLACPLLLQSV
jgi:hypothetical protein